VQVHRRQAEDTDAEDTDVTEIIGNDIDIEKGT
jgi:hypothetical protein